MTAKTAAERLQAFRERKEGIGLRRLEVYAHENDHFAIKQYVTRLNSARLRRQEREYVRRKG